MELAKSCGHISVYRILQKSKNPNNFRQKLVPSSEGHLNFCGIFFAVAQKELQFLL